MDFSLSAASQDASNRMWAFMREDVFPAKAERALALMVKRARAGQRSGPRWRIRVWSAN